jgi:signal peptidase I
MKPGPAPHASALESPFKDEPVNLTLRSTSRHLVEFAVVLVLAVLFLRVFIAEAYIVPTGSMAPALAGYHKLVACSACGFSTMVGNQGRNPGKAADQKYGPACCPNCGWDRLDLGPVAECSGDYLLVHKHVFDVRAPKRWEMIVFRTPYCQHDAAADTMIKRLVGLPGETIQICDGDVFINGNIARKTPAEFKAMRLPVHDNQYLPRDNAVPFRWCWGADSPWRAADGGRQFGLQPRAEGDAYDWLFYRHLVREVESGGVPCWREGEIKDVVGYNGGMVQDRMVHDLMVEGVVVARGTGWFALTITDGYDDVLIEIPVGKQRGPATLRHRGVETRRWERNLREPSLGVPADVPPARASAPFRLPEGRPVHVELGFVDRRVFLSLDGEDLFGMVDLPNPPPDRDRESLHRPLALGGHGPVSWGGRGLELGVGRLRIFRDIHYTDRNGPSALPHAIAEPVVLGAGEYFVLGDNSANSYDSRSWESPVVRHVGLVGKPFLLHLPTRVLEWRQFGEKRALAVPDWSRMKILR